MEQKQQMSVYDGLEHVKDHYSAVKDYAKTLIDEFVPAMQERIGLLRKMRKTHVAVMSAYEKAGMLNPKYRDWRLTVLLGDVS